MSGMPERTVEFAAIGLRHPLLPEDQARADFYALLGRLYASGPDAALLAAIGVAPPLTAAVAANDRDDVTVDLPAAWNALRAASATTDPEAAAREYDDLFVGVGKSEANLHASHWLSGFMMEKPLADVRATLATLGLGRRDGVTQVEDHLAALCETMRILIAGHDDRPPWSVLQQRSFFARHIEPWVFQCCTAIRDCAVANYYREVAQFTYCYLALERDSLAME